MSLQKFLEEWRQLPYTKAFERQADFPIGMTPVVHSEVLTHFYPNFPLLPLEFLKFYPDAIEAGFKQPPVHSFLSSGTTQRDRSRSAFSQQGMDLYREFSLLSFRAMLSRFFPTEARPAGFSFIPDTGEWPSSSLAQMVSWIAEEFPLTYWNPATPLPQDRPVWLFATGFHIVSFADEGGSFQLPPGSIVIETGGTKGKTRSVTRAELYGLIETSFGVDRNHIVSEYGMCELASQAYDFVEAPKERILGLDERWFRFPGWAQTKILTAAQTVAGEGDGSLIVDDRIRSDIGTPFRTEDRVLLRADGAFQLQGRVAFSPLKGCSLLVEDILKPKFSPPPSAVSAPASKEPSKVAAAISVARAKDLHRRTQYMLSDAEFRNLVLRSLGHATLADWWIQDLSASVPHSIEAWLAAGVATQNTLNSWLIIPPRTHEFAVMHPLFMAALLNLGITVRATLDHELLVYWQKLFSGLWQFEIIFSDWRLEPGANPGRDGLLVYGSDATITALKAATDRVVHGFGNWLTVSIIQAQSWEEHATAWIKDAFSLGQEGCMSSRLLIVWDDERPESLQGCSAEIGRLTHAAHLHLAHSELDLACQGFTLLPRPSLDHLVLGQRAWQTHDTLEALLSNRPLALPILRASRQELNAIATALEEHSSFRLISADAASLKILKGYTGLVTCELGKANAARWTGLHGGQPLFFAGEAT